MKIELKHNLDVLEIDTEAQSYSFETYEKEMFDLLFYGDSDISYFESKPDVTCYSGWGNYGDHDEEFTEVVVKNLGVWFLYYTDTIDQFYNQVNHAIYLDKEAHFQIS